MQRFCTKSLSQISKRYFSRKYSLFHRGYFYGVEFKVKYVDIKGSEKIYDVQGNEGDILLDTVKMAGIPIRCTLSHHSS